VPVEGTNDWANNAGIYLWSSYILNGKTVYINSAKSRFVGWSLYRWMIADTYYLSGILAAQGGYGGLGWNTGSDIMSGWGSPPVFLVERVISGQLNALRLVLSLQTPPSESML
jgi:hypothetical protein